MEAASGLASLCFVLATLQLISCYFTNQAPFVCCYMAGKQCCVGTLPDHGRTEIVQLRTRTAPFCRLPPVGKRQKSTRSRPCKRSGAQRLGYCWLFQPLLAGVHSLDTARNIVGGVQELVHVQRRRKNAQICNSLTAACWEAPLGQV